MTLIIPPWKTQYWRWKDTHRRWQAWDFRGMGGIYIVEVKTVCVAVIMKWLLSCQNWRYIQFNIPKGTVKLWDLRSRTYSRSFNVKGPVTSVALRNSRDEIISGDQNGCVKIWDLGSAKSINSVVPNPKGVAGKPVSIQAVDISDDDLTLVAVSNHATVFCWDPTYADNLKPITEFKAHPAGTYCLHAKLSPDSQHLVTTGSDGTARLFNTLTWELSQVLKNHTKWVWDAAVWSLLAVTR